MRLEALEHLFFYVFDVGEPVPTSDSAVFTGTVELYSNRRMQSFTALKSVLTQLWCTCGTRGTFALEP